MTSQIDLPRIWSANLELTRLGKGHGFFSSSKKVSRVTRNCLIKNLDFGELERPGLFKYVRDHPDQGFQYPAVADWLRDLNLNGLTVLFEDAGYQTVEQLLMQLRLREPRLNDQFLQSQVGVVDCQQRKQLLDELKRGISLYTTHTDLTCSVRRRFKGRNQSAQSKYDSKHTGEIIGRQGTKF